MVSYKPTRFLSSGRRVYKSTNGKIFAFTPYGGRTYRPKVSHVTKGMSKFTVKKHHKVYRGGKPVAKYSTGGQRVSAAATMLRRILGRRTMY